MAHIAVLGHGIVGSGVVELILERADAIAVRTGEHLSVKRILDIREFPGLSYSDKFTKDFTGIVNDPDIKVVVEVMGAVSPAYEYCMACLEAGKSVVTSNKELVAAKGALLLAAAAANGVHFLFEASVGGGIPVIAPMRRCFVANEILEIAGILNGTTNYILTKMRDENMSFSEALKQAQSLGYAEANPSADIEGSDACRKICILASLASGSQIYPENIHTQGITDITATDMIYAQNSGHVIKLIAQASRTSGGMYVHVGPAMLPRESLLAGVDDVFNGILVRGDAVGDVVFYGRGAGKLPTACAVISDIIECLTLPADKRPLWADSGENKVASYNHFAAKYYIRCNGDHAAITAIFGDTTPLKRENRPLDEHAFIIPEIPHGELQAKLSRAIKSGVQVLGAIRLFN